jgi:quercetin dioxygenase-like cupin family protein
MEKKNLRAIQQFSPSGFVRQRVWQSDQLHCNIYCFEPGQQNSLHRHPVADEVVFCWEDEGIIVVGNDHVLFKAGETVLVPKNTPHGYLNTSQERRMIITVVQCPLPVEHVAVEPGDLTAILDTQGAARP